MENETRFDDVIDRLKVLSGIDSERTNEFHSSDESPTGTSEENGEELVEDIKYMANVIAKRLIQPNIDTKISKLKDVKDLKEALKLISEVDAILKRQFNPSSRSSPNIKRREYLDHTSFS